MVHVLQLADGADKILACMHKRDRGLALLLKPIPSSKAIARRPQHHAGGVELDRC
jgi:hypothetical protein